MAELKPCPFCGGEIQALGTEKEAAEAWNRRANECDRDELLEVADEIEADAEHISEYLDSCEGNFTKDDAGEYYKLAGWHDRIRKALGVEELKPCPFCGSSRVEIVGYLPFVKCKGCGQKLTTTMTKKQPPKPGIPEHTRRITMPTNEERREVARKLRECADEYSWVDVRLIAYVFGSSIEENYEANELYCGTVEDIADLIEPEPERTCFVQYEYTGEPFFHSIHVHELSCGHDVRLYEDAPIYCPYCGAKVV